MIVWSKRMNFEWDGAKERRNVQKHGLDFGTARQAFGDPCRMILSDTKHSRDEVRWHCLGMVQGRVLTVRFTVRGDKIRIIGVGFWREGKEFYEKNKSSGARF